MGERISTWRDAELCVAAWMRLMGHSDARPTLSPSDGLDVISQTAIAQVRWRVAAASLIELRQFYESIAAPQADLYHFSRAGYTDDAVEWAAQVGMATFQLSPDQTIEPLNQPALVALQSVPPGATPSWSPIDGLPGQQPQPAVLRPGPAPAGRVVAPTASPVPYLPNPPSDQYSYLRSPDQAPYLPATTRSGLPAAQRPVFWTAPSHPGRGLRGWGIGLMIFGFLPALLMLLVLSASASGNPGPASVLVFLAFYSFLGFLGIGLYRAGQRKRDRQHRLEPPSDR